jgi:hypothetical protein
MKIGFLLPFAPNPRMKKRIAFFSQEHQVSVVYWKRSKTNLFRFDEKPEYEAINVEGNYGNPLGRIIPTIIFAYKAISCIRKIRPDIIYTQGIDMLFVAWLYSLGKKRKPKLSTILNLSSLHLSAFPYEVCVFSTSGLTIIKPFYL